MKNILLIGGTGVIGCALQQVLIHSNDYTVHITSRNKSHKDFNNIKFHIGDSLCFNFIKGVIKSENFDAIVDFMVYSTNHFKKSIDFYLNNCGHYIFLSSYRVYSDSKGILTEKSLRLIDDIRIDSNYRKSEEYAIKKAKQENIIFSHANENWTILRPSITFGPNRLQLFCFEASLFLPRINNNLAIIVPKNIRNIKTTYTDSDVAALYIFNIINNPLSYSEVFNLCSDSVYCWDDIFQFYSKEFKAQFIEVDHNIFKTLYVNQYQVEYDRMLNRQMSNLKIKNVIIKNIRESDLFEKLKIYAKKSSFKVYSGGRINGRMDKILDHNKIGLINSNKEKLKYIIGFNSILNTTYGFIKKNKYLK